MFSSAPQLKRDSLSGTPMDASTQPVRTASASDIEYRRALWTAIGVAILAITAQLMRVAATNIATALGAEIWSGFALLILALCTIWSTWFAIRHRRLKGKSLLPLAVCAAAIIVCITVPFGEWMLQADWRWHRSTRERIVAAVESGALTGPYGRDSTMVVSLPWGRGASVDGEIMARRSANGESILFFTFKGILSHYTGFLYRSDGVIPDHEFGDTIMAAEPIAPHWFFVWFA